MTDVRETIKSGLLKTIKTATREGDSEKLYQAIMIYKAFVEALSIELKNAEG